MAVFRKILALAAATTAVVSLSAPVSATTIYEFGGSTLGGGLFGALNIDVGAFNHSYYTAPPLSFTGDGRLSSQVNTTATVRANDFDFDHATGLQLFDVTANSYVNGLFTAPGAGAENEWVLNAVVTAGHTYNLIVNGTSNGPESSIAGQFSYSATPEAGTWMMMVAGFGLMGAAMRRRPRTQVTFA